MPTKKLNHLTIEADGSIREAQDHVPLSDLGQQWQERYEQGAELAINLRRHPKTTSSGSSSTRP